MYVLVCKLSKIVILQQKNSWKCLANVDCGSVVANVDCGSVVGVACNLFCCKTSSIVSIVYDV